MKLTAIAVTYGRKHNLGNYNSAHVEVSLWADLEEGEDVAAATLELRERARDEVKAELMRLIKADENDSA